MMSRITMAFWVTEFSILFRKSLFVRKKGNFYSPRCSLLEATWPEFWEVMIRNTFSQIFIPNRNRWHHKAISRSRTPWKADIKDRRDREFLSVLSMFRKVL